MSGLRYQGTSMTKFGRYLPNPLIDKIEIYEDYVDVTLSLHLYAVDLQGTGDLTEPTAAIDSIEQYITFYVGYLMDDKSIDSLLARQSPNPFSYLAMEQDGSTSALAKLQVPIWDGDTSVLGTDSIDNIMTEEYSISNYAIAEFDLSTPANSYYDKNDSLVYVYTTAAPITLPYLASWNPIATTAADVEWYTYNDLMPTLPSEWQNLMVVAFSSIWNADDTSGWEQDKAILSGYSDSNQAAVTAWYEENYSGDTYAFLRHVVALIMSSLSNYYYYKVPPVPSVIMTKATGDVSYEWVMKDGQVYGDPEYMFFDATGEVYDGIPLKALNGYYYKTSYQTDGVALATACRTLIEQVLADGTIPDGYIETSGGEVYNPSNEMESIFDSLLYVLETQADDPELLVSVDAVRKTWQLYGPGSLMSLFYTRLGARIIAFNRALKLMPRVVPRLAQNPKILDTRAYGSGELTEVDPATTWTPFGGSVEGFLYGGSSGGRSRYYMSRLAYGQAQALLGEDVDDYEGLMEDYEEEVFASYDTADVVNRGFFFYDMEKYLRVHSQIAHIFDFDKIEYWFGYNTVNAGIQPRYVTLSRYSNPAHVAGNYGFDTDSDTVVEDCLDTSELQSTMTTYFKYNKVHKCLTSSVENYGYDWDSDTTSYNPCADLDYDTESPPNVRLVTHEAFTFSNGDSGESALSQWEQASVSDAADELVSTGNNRSVIQLRSFALPTSDDPDALPSTGVSSYGQSYGPGLYMPGAGHDYRVMCFQFFEYQKYLSDDSVDYGADTSVTTKNLEHYRAGFDFYDNTAWVASAVTASYKYAMDMFDEYVTACTENCSYNPHDETFNDFFRENMYLTYSGSLESAPWVLAPTTYNIHRDLVTNYFSGSRAALIVDTKDISAVIDPRNGTLEQVLNFQTQMQNFWLSSYGDSTIVGSPAEAITSAEFNKVITEPDTEWSLNSGDYTSLDDKLDNSGYLRDFPAIYGDYGDLSQLSTIPFTLVEMIPPMEGDHTNPIQVSSTDATFTQFKEKMWYLLDQINMTIMSWYIQVENLGELDDALGVEFDDASRHCPDLLVAIIMTMLRSGQGSNYPVCDDYDGWWTGDSCYDSDDGVNQMMKLKYGSEGAGCGVRFWWLTEAQKETGIGNSSFPAPLQSFAFAWPWATLLALVGVGPARIIDASSNFATAGDGYLTPAGAFNASCSWILDSNTSQIFAILEQYSEYSVLDTSQKAGLQLMNMLFGNISLISADGTLTTHTDFRFGGNAGEGFAGEGGSAEWTFIPGHNTGIGHLWFELGAMIYYNASVHRQNNAQYVRAVIEGWAKARGGTEISEGLGWEKD